MQTVSSAFTTATSADNATLSYGAQISWLKTINSSYSFFTIGTSLIGGADIIPGSGSTPTFLDKYQYTDYTDYIDSWSVTRSLGQYPYGAYAASATLALDNSTFLFTPGKDPTIGNYITTGRPVKLAVGFNGETVQAFSGYSTQPSNDFNNGNSTLTCFDGMDYLNRYTSSTTATQVNVYADQIIIALLTEAGFSSSQYVVEQSLQQPIGYLAPYGRMIGDIIQQICEAEQGIAFFDENGIFRFWNRQHIANAQTPLWTFNYNNVVSWSQENTPVINDVVIQANPRTVQAKQNIWQLTAPVLIPANGTGTVPADFVDDDGALPVTSIDTPLYFTSTTSTQLSSYATNLNSDGTGTTGSASITFTSGVLSGSNYLMTFTNSSTQPIYITSLSLYGTPAKVTYVINQEYKDASSITANGVNPANNGQTLTISNDLIQTPSTALSNAYQLVTDYKTANQRVMGEVFEVPQLQIGDCVTMTFDDTGLSQNYTVVGNTLSFDAAELIKQQLELEVKQLVKYFQINVSTIGGADSIAP